MEKETLISLSKKGNRLAQKELYDRFSPFILGVIRRYISDLQYAEDVLTETFIKVFFNLENYSGSGSFEGWMRRIATNEALMFLRKRRELIFKEETEIVIPVYENMGNDLFERDILQLLDQLSPGYRTVFNLYVIEGYKHKEIAEILNISINTSKSQLIHAKNRLKQLIENQ